MKGKKHHRLCASWIVGKDCNCAFVDKRRNRPKKKFVEPKTRKCFGYTFDDGKIAADVQISNLDGVYDIPVRIISEKDYQRLLRLARRKS